MNVFKKPSNKQKPAQPSLGARLLRAQDEERRRISRELHDSVGQGLAAAKMAAETVMRRARLEENDRAAMIEAIAAIERASSEVRTVSYLLHPPLLEELGLAAAVRAYAEGFSKRSGVEVGVIFPKQLARFAREIETALFRVMQECLTNVHRYSGSSKANIRILSDHENLILEVEDFGGGIGVKTVGRETGEVRMGVGISGMRERIRELGGRLEIHSSKSGTSVIAKVPLPEPEAAPARKHEAAAIATKRILIIDDHELIRRSVRILIEKDPYLEICGEAADGIEAVAEAERLRPDLVILDLEMPLANGWGALRGMRKLGLTMPVIILSGHDHTFTREAAKNAHCDFVPKSRAGIDLMGAIRRALAAAESGRRSQAAGLSSTLGS